MIPVCLRNVASVAIRLVLAASGSLGIGVANAQTQIPLPPTVTVTASATATVTNDRMQAALRAEADDASAAAAASQVNAAIGRALGTAKTVPAVKVATAGYSTFQVSDKVNAQRWRVVQTISLESSDFTAAAALITRLQDEGGLLLSSMAFSLSDKARHDVEDGLTQQAIKGWQERAQRAAQGLGFDAWRPGHVTVQTEGGRVYPMPRMQALATPSAAPVAVEAGTSEVTVTVSGEAVLDWARPPAR
jgi:predicted secreted protein